MRQNLTELAITEGVLCHLGDVSFKPKYTVAQRTNSPIIVVSTSQVSSFAKIVSQNVS